MCNQQPSNPIAHYTGLLPRWGKAADEIYQNYHFLNLTLTQTDRLLIPPDALQKLVALKELLVHTLTGLLQDLPATTHRLSNETDQSLGRFNAHTITLQNINHQTDAIFKELLGQYPALQNWFDSIDDEYAS
ncbi:hypothetical protein [Larkinella rosea]|uniref:Uncharacterized protein n=1 Tax=Larkinella rosea TaxID=2025312 RepID=A0A3P1C331_9BACT|nr:hypothetical protein [Larkinella rosea]RRB07224.1 hypothetical protein EHT25_05440 [Larkinella rosea]